MFLSIEKLTHHVSDLVTPAFGGTYDVELSRNKLIGMLVLQAARIAEALEAQNLPKAGDHL